MIDIEARPLPDDYVHPQWVTPRGHWGIYEKEKLICIESTEQSARQLVDEIQKELSEDTT